MPTKKQLEIIIESETEFRPYDPGPGKPSMYADLKSLIRTHNFKSYPENGLLLLAEIKFNDESIKHSVLRRNYFCEEVLKEQKNDLEELKNLPKEFSSKLKEIEILDEKIEIRVENKIIKIFKNYSENEIGNVADEKNLEILKLGFSNFFPDYEIEIIRKRNTLYHQTMYFKN